MLNPFHLVAKYTGVYRRRIDRELNLATKTFQSGDVYRALLFVGNARSYAEKMGDSLPDFKIKAEAIFSPPGLLPGVTINVDMPSYTSDFSRNGEHPSGYSISWLTRKPPNIVTDCKYTLFLEKDGIGIACIGFKVDGYMLTVGQIQGGHGASYDYPQALSPVGRWDEMLLSIVTDWADMSGLNQVRVQPAENNAYWPCDGDFSMNPALGEKRRNLRLRYNRTARRCGFVFDKKSGFFILDLV